MEADMDNVEVTEDAGEEATEKEEDRRFFVNISVMVTAKNQEAAWLKVNEALDDANHLYALDPGFEIGEPEELEGE